MTYDLTNLPYTMVGNCNTVLFEFGALFIGVKKLCKMQRNDRAGLHKLNALCTVKGSTVEILTGDVQAATVGSDWNIALVRPTCGS